MCSFFILSAQIKLHRIINHSFSDKLGKDVYTYTYDLLICCTDVDSLLTNLEVVFHTQREASLKTKLTKCEFIEAKIYFLGHKIDGNSVKKLMIKCQPRIPHKPGTLSLECTSGKEFLLLKGSINQCSCFGIPRLYSPICNVWKCLFPWPWCCLHAVGHLWQASYYHICKSALNWIKSNYTWPSSSLTTWGGVVIWEM